MRTTLTKKNRITVISFTEADPTIRITTCNPSLKKRLLHYLSLYPSECQLLSEENQACLTFIVKKGRFGFRLTPPYSDSRRLSATNLAKRNLKKLHPPA